jgi:hypothetical protein
VLLSNWFVVGEQVKQRQALLLRALSAALAGTAIAALPAKLF